MPQPMYKVMHATTFDIKANGFVIAQYNDNLRDYVIPPYEEQGRSSWATVFPTSTNAWRFINNHLPGAKIAFVRTRFIPNTSAIPRKYAYQGWVCELENPQDFSVMWLYSNRYAEHGNAYEDLKYQLKELGCTIIIRGDNVDYLEN